MGEIAPTSLVRAAHYSNLTDGNNRRARCVYAGFEHAQNTRSATTLVTLYHDPITLIKTILRLYRDHVTLIQVLVEILRAWCGLTPSVKGV